jgi:hypothetical protein
MEMVVLFLVLIAFAVLAPRYGVDSRGAGGWSGTHRSWPRGRSRSMVHGSTEDRRSTAVE